MRRSLVRFILLGVLLLAIVAQTMVSFPGCGPDERAKPPATTTPPKPALPTVSVPTFNADSTFQYVKKQVDFGPRVPNTDGHRKCAAWLAAEFRRHGLTVIEQKFQAKHYLGTTYNCTNIIAQYQPENPSRIVFAAHWDSRFQADHDTKDKDKPIPGANDGGSGTAVLLELARLLQQQPADIGIDFVLFDAEDQGNDAEGQDNSETWCLGSQYWARHLHRPNYAPMYGVLLDMVGGSNPRFPKEGISTQVAPRIVDFVWSTAATLGYDNIFVPEAGPSVTDDHVFVIRDARIPMIDIIHLRGTSGDIFPDHWHTHNDNLQAIDKGTLRAVGEVCTKVIYLTAAKALNM
jgi:glutaminyl-peptide cyclotransferase